MKKGRTVKTRKVRRRQRAAKRTRSWRLNWNWKPFLAILAVGSLLTWWLLTDPAHWFRLQQVKVTGGEEHVSPAEVLKRAAPPYGAPLLSTPLQELRQRLTQHPWIRSVGLRRLLPDTLYIHVSEEVPAALLSLSKLFLVTAEGNVFKKMEPGDPKDLPIITGLTQKQSKEKPEWFNRRLQESLMVVNLLRESGALHPYGLSELHWNKNDTISLTTRHHPFTIVLGKRPWRQKMEQLIQIFPQLRQQGRQPKLVKLDQNEGIIVRYKNTRNIKGETHAKKRR